MLMAAVAGECSRFQLIPPNFFFPSSLSSWASSLQGIGAFVMFNLVQAPGRLKLALVFGHDTLVPVVFALWPRLPAWPLPSKNRSEGACSEHLSAKREGDVAKAEDSAPGAAGHAGLSAPAGLATWARLAAFRNTPTSLDPCLAWSWSSSATRPCGTLHSASVWFEPSSHKPGELIPFPPFFILVGVGQRPGTWDGETSRSLYSSLGWRRTLKLRRRPPSW